MRQADTTELASKPRGSLGVRWGWLFVLALLMQLGLAYLPTKGMLGASSTGLLGASYSLLLAGALGNLHLWGFRLFLVGLVLNLLAVSLNGWRMPVSPEALFQAGLTDRVLPGDASTLSSPKGIILSREATRLWFLTDVIALGSAARRVISVGDMIIAGGVALTLLELWFNHRRTIRQKL